MKEIVLSAEEIQETCKRIGAALTERLANEEKVPLVLVVMRGAMNFAADLIKEIKADLILDYVQVRSYEGTSSSGKIIFDRDTAFGIEGRTLVIIEDVIDTGITMKFLKEHFAVREPKQIIVASLLDKRAARKVPIEADYVGKTLYEDKFVVGYGLDYCGLFRNIPYVYIPEPSEVVAWDKRLAQ